MCPRMRNRMSWSKRDRDASSARSAAGAIEFLDVPEEKSKIARMMVRKKRGG